MVDLTTMIVFVFWQMEVPIVIFSLIPMILNIWLLFIQDETKRSLFKHSNNLIITVFYVVMGIILITYLSIGLIFLSVMV